MPCKRTTTVVAPAAKPSALMDTRVIYGGDNLDTVAGQSSVAYKPNRVAPSASVRHTKTRMLKPILRHFEFEYEDGYQFWDKAGRVARDLVQAIPGLRLRNQLIDQRDFFLPGTTLELHYGIRFSSLRCFEGDAQEFRKQASLLIEILNEELELQTLARFRFQLALGWPCKTVDEAYVLTMKLLPADIGGEVKSGEFQAAQLEIRKGAALITTRYTVLENAPPPGLQTPHFAAVLTYESFERVSIRDFKATATLEQIENTAAADLLKRITSHLDAKPT